MTSKEAFEDLEYIVLDFCDKYGKQDKYVKELIEIIKKDLEVLEILKKHIYFSSKSGCIRMKDIYKSINNFDYEDLKEWLENE